VVGIDFGTTFTGVAYAHSGDLHGSLKAIAREVKVVNRWPNPTSAYEGKIPTIIAYRDRHIFGGSVRPRDEEWAVTHFKIGLQPNAGTHYASGDKVVTVLPFLDPNYRHPKFPNKLAVDFAADYLRCVNDFVRGTFFDLEFGSTFLRNQKIAYVITVPAIWKDKAANLTRQAAERAGIPGDDLTIITEPEAAALYCAIKCDEVDLGEGDRFLVCDAGGGTVVCILRIVSSDLLGSDCLSSALARSV
jgi:Hsp70 protein